MIRKNADGNNIYILYKKALDYPHNRYSLEFEGVFVALIRQNDPC